MPRRINPAWPLILLALAVRLLGIISRPIWYDEAFSILFARQGPAAMLAGTLAPTGLGSAVEIHPLGYYTVLWLWMKMFGESILAARLLSALLGLGIVWLGIRFLNALFEKRVAWWGGIFLALGPFLVHHGQEIRMYGLLSFWLLAATLVFWRAAGLLPDSHPSRGFRDWALFALLAALAQYTHNLAAFYLLPLAAIPAFRRDWRSVRNAALAGMAALLLYLPWLFQIPAQFAKVNTAYWTTRPGFSRLITTLLTFVTNLPVPPERLPFALSITFLLVFLAAWQTFRATRLRGASAGLSEEAAHTTRSPDDSPGAHRSPAAPGLWLAYLAFAPPLLMFAFSQWVPIYVERALLPSGVLFLLWTAWALRGTPMPRLVRSAAAVIFLAGMLLGLQEHIRYVGFPYAPFHELNADLSRRASPDAVILHASKLSGLPAYLDAPDLPIHYLADPQGSGTDTLSLPAQEAIGFRADSSVEQAVAGAGRVFFVVFSRELAEYEAQGNESHPALQELAALYTLRGVQTWGELQVFEFEAGPETDRPSSGDFGLAGEWAPALPFQSLLNWKVSGAG